MKRGNHIGAAIETFARVKVGGLKSRPELAVLDRGVITVGLLLAALDGTIMPEEIQALKSLAKKCRGGSEKNVRAVLDAAVPSVGRLMATAQFGACPEKRRLRAFVDSAKAALPRGFEDGTLADLRRAFALWITVGFADGEFSGLERSAVKALEREFASRKNLRLFEPDFLRNAEQIARQLVLTNNRTQTAALTELISSGSADTVSVSQKMEGSIQKSVASALRTHVGVFGKMNAGKSTLINAIIGQEVSIVSDTPGTTTDVVRKAIEIGGVGPCVFLDTAGFDDFGGLGTERVRATMKAATTCDIALVVFPVESEFEMEGKLAVELRRKNSFVIGIVNYRKAGESAKIQRRLQEIEKLGVPAVAVNAAKRENIGAILELMKKCVRKEEKRYLTGGLVKSGDTVLLVTGEDGSHEPEGRISLPETQTIRELIDLRCSVVYTCVSQLRTCLAGMRRRPDLIVCDATIFGEVYAAKPEACPMTIYTTMFAGVKGDMAYFSESVPTIDRLNGKSKVLISECCSHSMAEGDIGGDIIPSLIDKRLGRKIKYDFVTGTDFPSDLSPYDMVIMCGGCMVNRHSVMSRVNAAKEAGVPMTDFGVALAFLRGILDKISLPNLRA